MMERYTSEQRVEIIKIYYRNSESVASTLRALRPIYGNARSIENIATAESSVEESPNVSLTRRSPALGISVTSLWRILRDDLAKSN